MSTPKILHRVWLGGGDIPYAEYWQRWLELHPHWQTFTHTDSLACESLSLKAQADITRAAILARVGGVYVDCDVEPVANIDALTEFDLFAPLTYGRAICNCFVGCAPEHPQIVALAEHLKECGSITDIYNDVGSGKYSRVLTGVTRLRPYDVDALASKRAHAVARFALHWGAV